MKKKLVKLSKRPFLRNVVIMATGTIAAQIITIILSPIITRLYGPEAFGLLGVFTAVIGIISPIAALTYPTAIVLPKSNNEAKGLVHLSIFISIIIGVIITVLLVFFNQQIVTLFNIEDIAPFLYLIPIVVLISGLVQVVEQWLIRIKQFKITARVTIIQSIIVNGGKVGIGLFNPVAIVLIVMTVFSQLMKSLLMVFFVRRSNYIDKEVEEKKGLPISLSKLAKKYREFPVYRAPQIFINAITQSLPILMLTSLFGPASAGFYSIGRTVLNIPSQLIGKSVGDVFYPRIAEASNNGENINHLIKRATLALAGVGLIPYGLVVIFGPWIFSFVFGADWVTAGEYARWIALWIYFMFMNQPSVKALLVMSEQEFHLKFTILSLILRMLAITIGYLVFSSDLVAVAFFGISGAILSFTLILITLKKGKKFN